MMEWAKRFAKNALFYLNCVYGVVGLVIGVLGFVVMVKWIFTTAERDRTGWSWLFYVMAGVLMAATAFFGCYAAVRERRLMLIAHAIFMVTVLVLQVVLAVWLSFDSCFVVVMIDSILEALFRRANSTIVNLKPKECMDSPFEVWTGFHATYFCSAFHDGPCGPNQDMFRRWHIPTCIVSFGVPLIEVIGSCVALFLAIYLEITKRRARAAVTEKNKDIIPEAKQALVSD